MTNKEVSNAARRIEFTPVWPEVFPEVAKGLTNIVNRQVRRSMRTNRDELRFDMGRYCTMLKAPGHDAADVDKALEHARAIVAQGADGPGDGPHALASALLALHRSHVAVKAAKARKHDEYSVLGATDEQSWSNYLQDCRRRGERGVAQAMIAQRT